MKTGELLSTLIHHGEAVLHMKFCDGIMVTCSKVQVLCITCLRTCSGKAYWAVVFAAIFELVAWCTNLTVLM